MRSCLALVFFAQGLGPVVRLLSGLYSDWLFVPVRSGWFASFAGALLSRFASRFRVFTARLFPALSKVPTSWARNYGLAPMEFALPPRLFLFCPPPCHVRLHCPLTHRR